MEWYGQEMVFKYDSNRDKNNLFALSVLWIAKSNGGREPLGVVQLICPKIFFIGMQLNDDC